MRIGIVGNGRWGKVYARTFAALGIPTCNGWDGDCDGAVIATPRHTHYRIAREILYHGIPIILEKPVTLDPAQAWELVGMGGIVYTGHTRLFSTTWRRFRESLKTIDSVSAVMGRATDDPWWEIAPHPVSMCIDLGFDPRKADIRVTATPVPLSFTVNNVTYEDVNESPTPMEVLITEFVAAIERGKPDNKSLILGAQVVEFLNEFRGLHSIQDCACD